MKTTRNIKIVLFAFVLSMVFSCSKNNDDSSDLTTLLILYFLSTPQSATLQIKNSSGSLNSYAMHTTNTCTDSPLYTLTPAPVNGGATSDSIKVNAGAYTFSVGSPYSSNCRFPAITLSGNTNYLCTAKGDFTLTCARN